MLTEPVDQCLEAFCSHLLSHAVIGNAELTRARHAQGTSQEDLVYVLTSLGLVSEDRLAAAVANFLHSPLMAAEDFPNEPVLADVLPDSFLRRHHLIPVSADDDILVCTAGPVPDEVIATIRYATTRPVRLCVATQSNIANALDQLYQGQLYQGANREDAANQPVDISAEGRVEDTEHLRELASEAPVIRLINRWIAEATALKASDIHIEPTASAVRVRFRLDGALKTVEEVERRLAAGVTSRIKIMAKLDISERRLPQDGKFRMAVKGRSIDVRVSTVPTVHGESVVLRLLDRSEVRLEFDALGYNGATLKRFRSLLDRPNGIVLVTGPTGSGKTTTLYTSLLERLTPDVKILTVEDPIEYELEGINQTQVRPQ